MVLSASGFGVNPRRRCSAAEISRLFAEPAFKTTFERKFGAGSADRYITVPPSPEAEDLRQGIKTIFTVCVSNLGGK